jgi:hypothetical protein
MPQWNLSNGDLRRRAPWQCHEVVEAEHGAAPRRSIRVR